MINEVAVESELADDGIDLAKGELRPANPICFFLACTQVCPLGGCLGIRQRLLQLLDLALDVISTLSSGLLLRGGSDGLQDAKVADQALLFAAQIFDTL